MKAHTFEELPSPVIALDLEYTTESITLQAGWQDVVMMAYVRAARKAMTEIESQVMDLEFDDMPAKWMKEAA